MHRPPFAASQSPTELADENVVAHRRRIVNITRRREFPSFLICDASMRVLFASAGIAQTLLSNGVLQSLESRCRESRASNSTLFIAYDDETVLRIVPLDDQLFGCIAIFMDVFGRRGSVFEAAKTFGLTRRESEVLQLLLRATTNTEIANSLSVGEGTVGDHVKSIMRKMGTSKRAEIIGKVFKLEQDIAVEQLQG